MKRNNLTPEFVPRTPLVGPPVFQPVAAIPAAGVTRLGMEVKKEDNLADWYSQVNKLFNYFSFLKSSEAGNGESQI